MVKVDNVKYSRRSRRSFKNLSESSIIKTVSTAGKQEEKIDRTTTMYAWLNKTPL